MKILGSVLVLAACIGYSSYLLEKQKSHRDILQAFISMLDLLSGKLRYERLAMGEALAGLNRRYHGAVGSVMGRIADRLACGVCENLEEVWREEFAAAAKALMLTEEEKDIILETGKNLGYLDVDAQMGHLKLCRERLQGKLAEAETELAERRKLYRYLGMAVGVMVILILI